MLIRVLSDNTVVVVNNGIPEDEFIAANPTGGFRAIDALPASASKKWKLVGNEIVSDADADLQLEANMYRDARAAEYPPITDYLDGVVKGDQAQINKYIADCQAVKDKYPKGA